jgi:hypothetical protein
MWRQGYSGSRLSSSRHFESALMSPEAQLYPAFTCEASSCPHTNHTRCPVKLKKIGLSSLKCAAHVAPCCTSTSITHGHTRVRSLWDVCAAAPPAHAWLWPQEGQAAGPVARFSLPAGPIGAYGLCQARTCTQQGQGKGPAAAAVMGCESGSIAISVSHRTQRQPDNQASGGRRD